MADGSISFSGVWLLISGICVAAWIVLLILGLGAYMPIYVGIGPFCVWMVWTVIRGILLNSVADK